MGIYTHKSILQESIKSLTESTWESLHRLILDYVAEAKIETGSKESIDSTAIETKIHAPSDSSLLFDGIRIMTRWMIEGHQLKPLDYRFSDHRRVAQKHAMTILNGHWKETRVAAYHDRVDVAVMVCGYAKPTIPALNITRTTVFRTAVQPIFWRRNLSGPCISSKKS